MRLSAKKSYKSKAKMKKLGGFGKKWKAGDKLRVIYRVFWDEEENEWTALVAQCYGHSLDPNATNLKRVFLPTLSDINEYGEPVHQDYSYQFARIARWILNGQRKREEDEIKSNKMMTESVKETSLTKIKEDYEKKKPILGSLELRISTECFVIPVDKNDVPDFDNASLCSQDIGFSKIDAISVAANSKVSKEIFIVAEKDATGENVTGYKIDYLTSLIREDQLSYEQKDIIEAKFNEIVESGNVPASFKVSIPKFFKDPKMEFIEISYAFKNKESKAEAGNITPLGVEPEYALSCNPDYKEKIYGYVGQLPVDTETIQNRNSSFRPVGETEIKHALSTYAAMNYKALDALETDEVTVENMKKNIDVFKLFSIPVSIPAIVDALDELNKKEEEAKAEAAIAGSGAPTMDSLTGKKAVEKEDIQHAKENVEENLGEIMEESGIEIQADITEA